MSAIEKLKAAQEAARQRKAQKTEPGREYLVPYVVVQGGKTIRYAAARPEHIENILHNYLLASDVRIEEVRIKLKPEPERYLGSTKGDT